MSDKKCMICGHIISDDRHICLNCERVNDMQTFKKPKPKTNGDRIRHMTDEELCEFLDGFLCYEVAECRAEDIECRDCKMKWLKEEAKDDAKD